jgi:hypothetical protein
MADDLQQRINEQIGDDRVGGGLSLPKGEIVVGDTLEIVRVRGFKFGGQGPLVTQLRWAGPDDRPMFRLDRCLDVLMEDFSIIVSGRKELLAGAWIQNTPVTEWEVPTSHVWWRNVHVIGQGRLTRGFHVMLVDPKKDEKNDNHTFEGLTVTGYKHAAFSLEGRNAKNIGFDPCHCVAHVQGVERPHEAEKIRKEDRIGKYAIDTARQAETGFEWNHGGAFFWNNGAVIAHAEADFRIGDRNDTIKINGVYSEKSNRMLEMPDYRPGGGAACPLVLENYRFAAELAAEDGEVIQCRAAGPLSMIGCKMGSTIPGMQLRIGYDPRPAPGAFVFIGNAIANDGDGHVFTASPPTVPYETANLGYRGGKWGPLGTGL